MELKLYLTVHNEFAQADFKSITVGQDWAQGRSIFGGLMGALLLKACENVVSDSERKVRNVQITFVGPVMAGIPITFETKILRQGGSVSTVESKAIQDGNVQTVMTACFGKHRESKINKPNAHPCPNYPSVDELEVVGYIPDITPLFMQHYRLALAEGHYPYSGKPSSIMGGVCRFGEEKNKATEADLIALLDTWPPVASQELTNIVPVSTLTWTIQFVQDMPDMCISDWFHYQAHSMEGSNGYSNSLAYFWSEKKQLLALSTQTLTIFG